MTTTVNERPEQVIAAAADVLPSIAESEAEVEARAGLSPAAPSPTAGDASLDVAASGLRVRLDSAQAQEVRDAESQNQQDEAVIEAAERGEDQALPDGEPRRKVARYELYAIGVVMGYEMCLLPGPLATAFDFEDGSLWPIVMAAAMALFGAYTAHRFGEHWPSRNARRPGDRQKARRGLVFWGSLLMTIAAAAVAMRLNAENQDRMVDYGLGLDTFGVTTYLVVQLIVVSVALGLGACFGSRVATAMSQSIADWIDRLRSDVRGRQHLLEPEPAIHERQHEELDTIHLESWVLYRNNLATKHTSVAGQVAWADRNARDFAALGIAAGGGDPAPAGPDDRDGPHGGPAGAGPGTPPGDRRQPDAEPAPPAAGVGTPHAGPTSSVTPGAGPVSEPQSDEDLIDAIFGEEA